ncbi:MAG TPA: TetR/AcrR family transcriptional regulator [Acetobacteraceae bacterium]|nr:TetR/AcrR family transcriptional regulator [Acetobacteraceae bacterium]
MREDVQALKRERIIAEAVRLFYDRGYTGTTLDDVAAALGVTKPFIYTYFTGKTDLLAAICQPTIELSLAALMMGCEHRGPVAERLRRAVAGVTRVVLERQAQIAVFFREEKHLAPEALDRINRLRRQFDRTLAALLAEGTALGAFTVADPAVAALAIGGMISWSYTWHRPHGRLSIEALGEQMADLAVGMVGARTPAAA